MKKLFVFLITLILLTGCMPVSNPIPGIDKLNSCESCTVQVTRYETNTDNNQWKGIIYSCTINSNSCSCQKLDETSYMKLDGIISQPYPLDSYMSSCGLK